MDESFTVVIATHGAVYWESLAKEHALPSAKRQRAASDIVMYHGGDTVAEARNKALEQVRTEFVIFLDADDQLETGYVAEMRRGSADVRCPATRRVYHYGPTEAWVPKVWQHQKDENHQCTADCLKLGNWLVIGAAVRTHLIRKIGGFDPQWPVYEDFDVWQRCYLAGATFEARPKAVYRAWAHKGSRNRSMSTKRRNRIHEQIDVANGLRRRDGVY